METNEIRERILAQDARNDRLMEQEMIPLARAMVGWDVQEMRKIKPEWCLRPDAQQIYAIAIKTPDNELYNRFNLKAHPDEYLFRATKHIADVNTNVVVNAMHDEWVHRKEQELLQTYVGAETNRQKNGVLNALKNLFREDAEEAYVVDVSNPSPPEVFALEWHGIGFMPRGEITDIKAKAKSGKTQLVKQFVAALISPNKECNGIKRIDDEPMCVLWLDTEQSHSSSDRAYYQTLKLAGLETSENTPYLKLINTRKMNADKRWQTLEAELNTQQYDVVVIDGLRDLFKDINDPAETTDTFERMLRLTQDTRCSFVLVIHENPGDSSKMRGWMGTEAENKSYEVFQIKYSDETQVFTVKTTDRRGPILDPIGFRFEDNQLVACEPDGAWSQGQGQNARISKDERNWLIFVQAWKQNPHLALTKEEIVNSHLAMGTLKETTVKNRIKEYLAQKKLVCTGDPTVRGSRFGLSFEEVNKLVNPNNDQTNDTPF